MASSRWALRAAATLTALAFALPFSTGTANADPILVLLEDNHVNATVGISGNVDMIPVAAGAHVSLDTGHGLSVMANGGIQVALGLCGHADVGLSAGVDVGAHVSAAVDAHVDAVVEVAAEASPAVDRAPAPEPVVAATPAVEPVVAAAPAEPAVEPAADKASTSVEIGGVEINVGPHAAAMLQAHADATKDVHVHVDGTLAVDASLGADVSVGVSSDLVNIDAHAGVAADASVDLGSGDVSASAYIGVGLTIG
ncbi:hypothetical protein [Lentzea sp. NPDC051838]|uniref:hypothetical protein n=1 Tax=Lentzea sp. NPDC051838 TaxID=3154849 RepID=UPI00343160DD